MMANNELTDEEKKTYAAVNRKFGMDDLESTYHPEDYNNGDTLTFSADPEQSDIPPRIITVQTIADLKNLIGNPAERDDTDIDYPADPANSTADQVRANLQKALSAYVLGKPEKVMAYEPLINAEMFPMSVAYFAAATTHVIDKPIVVTGPSPVAWNYASIVFKSGGNITADVNFTITCTTMSKEA